MRHTHAPIFLSRYELEYVTGCLKFLRFSCNHLANTVSGMSRCTEETFNLLNPLVFVLSGRSRLANSKMFDNFTLSSLPMSHFGNWRIGALFRY